MLYLYRAREGRLETCPIEQAIRCAHEVFWVDLVSATESERAFVEKYFALPTRGCVGEHIEDLEFTARFFEDPLGIHILSLFVGETCTEPIETSTVLFILQNDKLFSMRETDLPAFSIYQSRCKKNTVYDIDSSYNHFLNLLEIETEILADALEFIYHKLDILNAGLMTNLNRKQLLVNSRLLSKLELSCYRLQLCLTDHQRCALFFMPRMKKLLLPESLAPAAKRISSNLESLLPHNEAVCSRIEFFTQTAMGLSEIHQNEIMKTLSRVMAVSVPSALITAFLGMDTRGFFGIPGCSLYALGIFTVAMIVVSVALIIIARKKEWFADY